MTVPNSIFQQLCPACATSIPINAQRCECGHDLTGQGTQLETLVRDEELYENYLIARVTQAQESVQVALHALMEDEGNEELMAAHSLAREVASSIEEDLASQRTKLEKLRSQLPPPVFVMPAVEAARSEPAPVVPKEPEPAVLSSTEASETIPAPATKPVAVTPAPRAINEVAASPIIILSPTPLAPDVDEHAAPSTLATPPSTLHKAANALSALKQAKAREGAQQLAALRAQIARQKQAEKEKLAMAELEAAQERMATRSVAPPAAFREEQAVRAERVLQQHVQLSGKDCPNCTSRVALNATRCQCGYAFAGGDTELPSLTLCTGDFTALRNTFLADLRGRR